MHLKVMRVVVVVVFYLVGLVLSEGDYTTHAYESSVFLYNDTNPHSCEFGKDLSQIHDILSIMFKSLSIITCGIAFLVYFLVRNIPEIMRESKRHWIHWNFMMSFILRDTVTLTYTAVITVYIKQQRLLTQPGIKLIYISTAYTQATNVFWMFTEGLYLLLGLILHLRLKQVSWMRLKLFLLGWGVPGLIVAVWAVQQLICNQGLLSFDDVAARIILSGPLYFLLFANLLIIIRVLYTLRGMIQMDLRQKDTVKTLAKRTLVLSILLGMYFLLPIIIHAVTDGYCGVTNAVLFINSLVSSLYGFLVALLYVLLNNEVMDYAIRHMPSWLQGPVTNLRLRTPSSTSTSSMKTKVTTVHTNNNKNSFSFNPSPNVSPRSPRHSAVSNAAKDGYSQVQMVYGTHLTPGDEVPSHQHDPNEKGVENYTETTFTFNSPHMQGDVV
ncbi:corticotropin-releasing factor receptor 1-like [Amphiura filiformis]|uniref:corticotropin-releasing factor receptor 1-like n=1 Tax=Amphiura filiformis TaxID=82378 RepID=UPI003B2152C2